MKTDITYDADRDGRAFLEWLIVPALLLVGFVRRMLLYQGLSPGDRPDSEAFNVAVSIARHGTFADPFPWASGLTTHLSPVMPWIVGMVYRALGINTVASDLVLLFFALLCVSATAITLYGSAKILGFRYGALVGLALFAILAPFGRVEVTSFRVWEGALSTALASILLWAILQADRREDARWQVVCGIAALAGFLFLVSLPLGLAGFLNCLILFFRIVPKQKRGRTATIAFLSVLLVLAPWTIRNLETFGRFIPVRGNAGLEVKLAYNDLDLKFNDQREVFNRALRIYHPASGRAAFLQMKQEGGEIMYADHLGREAVDWIKSRPILSLQLTLGHLLNFYFLPAWVYNPYVAPTVRSHIRAYAYWPIVALGLLGIGYTGLKFRGRFLYAAIAVTIPALPYMLVHPSLRYSYTVSPILTFSTSILVVQIILSLMTRHMSRKSGRSSEVSR